MAGNPVSYTSRTYLTILADINADPTLVDKPDWWKRMIAGLGDVLSFINNASANQTFLRTAFTKQAVADLSEQIDYFPTPQVMASGLLMFDIIPTLSFPYSFAVANLAAMAPGSVAIPSRRFESRVALAVSSLTEVTAYTTWVVADDKITVAAVFTTGEKVRLTFSATPPTTVPQVAVSVDYFAIYVDVTHIRLATSRANAFAGTYIDITAQGTGNHTLTRLSRSVAAYQQTSVSSGVIGTSDGATAWQEFTLPRVGIDASTIAVVINGVTWTKVDTPVYSVGTDKVYRVIPNTDGTMRIRFGNGTYGAIPGAFDVYAAYAYGGGAISNVSQLNVISQYAGTDTNCAGVFNPVAFTGGADAESIETSKILGPLLLKARDRFVTEADGEALALAYGGLSLVKINRNAFGPLTAEVVGIANGGGDPSAPLKALIVAYLVARSILDSIAVTFSAATLTIENVTSAVHVASGYTWAAVQPYVRLAWKMFFSECGNEILTAYRAGGVAAATTLINTIFSESFTSADYAAVSRLLDPWIALMFAPRDFGDYITQSDAFAYIQGCVQGIDYMTIAAPSFPITLGTTEITTVTGATITLTSI
jgi:hypothetical protein